MSNDTVTASSLKKDFNFEIFRFSYANLYKNCHISAYTQHISIISTPLESFETKQGYGAYKDTRKCVFLCQYTVFSVRIHVYTNVYSVGRYLNSEFEKLISQLILIRKMCLATQNERNYL